jgi:hypothetical protein
VHGLAQETPDGWTVDLEKDPGEWLRDPKLFDRVLTAIIHGLMWFMPPGSRYEQTIHYNSAAEQIIDEIRALDPSIPIQERSTRQHGMAMLKDQLGDLADRPHTHDQWTRATPPTRTSGTKNGRRKRR